MGTQPLFCRQSGFGPLATLVARAEGEAALSRLLREEGIALQRQKPTAPLSFASMSAVFEGAARLTGDSLFGFRVGMGMRPEDYGPFVDYALAAPVLEHAMRRICNLALLQTNAVSLDFAVEDEGVVWRLNYHSGMGLARHQHALHILPSMLIGLKQYLGQERIAGAQAAGAAGGIRLDLPLPQSRSTAALEEAAGLVVRRDANRYALVFPKAWLKARPVMASRSPLTFCDVYNRYFPHLPRNTAEAVQLVIEPVLANGTVHIEDVARQLGVSRRKLQSDLNGEGHAFRDLLRALRTRRAMRLMRETTDTLAEIALSVGYSDQAHFHRAFAAVTGMAPGEWRSGRVRLSA